MPPHPIASTAPKTLKSEALQGAERAGFRNPSWTPREFLFTERRLFSCKLADWVVFEDAQGPPRASASRVNYLWTLSVYPRAKGTELAQTLARAPQLADKLTAR